MSILADPTPAERADVRRQARSLYWRGWGITDVADELGQKRGTVEAWKIRDKWDEAPAIRRMEDSLEIRWNALVLKEKKTGSDFKEIDLLGRQIAQLARVRRFEEPGGHEGDLNDKVANRNAGPKKKAKTNHFTAEQAEQLLEIFKGQLYGYQESWYASSSLRTRMILKSRQIGATYYFAFEALIDAVQTGRNQVFLSASKAQAHQFKNYIVGFAKLVGVDLKGDPMLITSELRPETEAAAELHFLGTNFRTAQGRSANFYFDEFFWTHGFEELNKVASAMATHTRWRKTYFSTPSTTAHPAYPYWTGERRNRKKKRADRITIDVSHKALKDGRTCEDGIWRQIVTVHDAIAGGFDLVNLDELHADHPDDEFDNLFGCVFVDDSNSAFKFEQLVACGCDSMIDWTDVRWESRRLYAGNVWAGYDPQESEDGDNAALVIAIPPATPGGKFRLLEKHSLRGLDFQAQAEFIAATLRPYNCSYIGIDGSNAMGSAVAQLLRDKVPASTTITLIPYDIATKAQMVMKAQHTIGRGRVAFDYGWTDLISAFLSIKKTLTQSGRSVTYKTGRTAADVGTGTSHADLAWAVMHILINEPLDGSEGRKTSMEIF